MTSLMCSLITGAMAVDSHVCLCSFFDVTAGISDPNVFIPPPECQQRA